MYDNKCDIQNTIRPTSSSLARGPSWSFGVGANNGAEEGDNSSQRIPNNDDDDSNSIQNNRLSYPKLDLQIPTVYLTKRDPSKSSFHVYELRIKLLKTNQEWSVYRRYSQFHALHQQLKGKDSAIGKLHLPPKKRLNSKASTIVQDRRRKLEEYIKSVNFYIDHLPADNNEEENSGHVGPTNIEQHNQLRSMLSIETATSSIHLDEASRETLQSDCISSNSEQPEWNAAAANRCERTRSVESEDLAGASNNTCSASCNSEQQQQDGIDEFFDGCSGKSFEKFSIRMLFNIFISLKDKRDEEFSPSELDNTLNDCEETLVVANNNPSS